MSRMMAANMEARLNFASHSFFQLQMMNCLVSSTLRRENGRMAYFPY